MDPKQTLQLLSSDKNGAHIDTGLEIDTELLRLVARVCHLQGILAALLIQVVNPEVTVVVGLHCLQLLGAFAEGHLGPIGALIRILKGHAARDETFLITVEILVIDPRLGL